MTYLTLDIGGSSVKYALMNEEAQILSQGKEKISSFTEEDALFSALRNVKESVKQDYHGVAVSMPGRIDTVQGIAHTGGSFRFIKEMPMAARLQEVFGKDVTIANDGKCAANAEAWRGALSDVESGAVIVLGTGIGGGVVLDHKVRLGAHFGAGEFSIIPADYDLAFETFRFGEGMKNPYWSGHATAFSFARDYAEAAGLGASSYYEAKPVLDRVHAGDETACRIFTRFTRWVAVGILSLQAVLDAERYAIGGGISADPLVTQKIAEAVHETFSNKPWLPFGEPEVVTCAFENDANLIGALRFYQQLKEGH